MMILVMMFIFSVLLVSVVVSGQQFECKECVDVHCLAV